MNNDTLACSEPHTAIISLTVIINVISVVSIVGLLGNGAVIWLLGFRMKRTPFTTYILNLAVADFGVLIASVFIVITNIVDITLSLPRHSLALYYVISRLFHFAYSMSQFLLTAISIDRCLSLFFPLWYRFRRPAKFSTVLCALIWLLTFLVHGYIFISYFIWGMEYPTVFPLFYVFLVTAMVCLPLVTVSTLILFVRFCFKPQQRQRGKLLTAILLTLIFFLIFAFPLNVVYLIRLNPNPSKKDLSNVMCNYLLNYAWLFASLNSFINPLFYFLVGTKKRGLCGVLKLVLQRVFTEEEEARREEQETQI